MKKNSKIANELGIRDKGKKTTSILKILPFLKPYKLNIIYAFIFLIITSSATLSVGIGVKYLIDEGLVQRNTEILNFGIIFLLFLVVTISTGTYFRFYFISWVGERVVADIRIAVYSRVLRLSPVFFEKIRTGEVLTRITADTSVLQSIIGSSLSIALRNFITLLGGLILLFFTSPKLTLLASLVIPAVIVPIIFYGKRVRRLSRASQDRIADIGAYAEESINAIETVQSYSHEKIDRDNFNREVENTFLTSLERIYARAMLGSVVIFLVFGSISLILWAGSIDVINKKITAGSLTSFVFYAVIVAGAVGALTEVFGELQRGAGAAERLFELLEVKPEIVSPKVSKIIPHDEPSKVEFNLVSFSYPSRPKTSVINKLTFTVDPGEKVALVGPSGAGKTSIFKLLLRFYDPFEGEIKINNINIRESKISDFRTRIGLVSQDSVIFSTSALENIRYGKPDATVEEVIKAASSAMATEFIEKMPDGFNTFLGEKGVRLSGGQKQRISIARAILRDPSILLLDEATSALDSENEKLVQTALSSVMKDRTTIVIAHRLSTVVSANRILILNNGTLQGIGTHQSLLSNNSLYSKLAKLQFNHDL